MADLWRISGQIRECPIGRSIWTSKGPNNRPSLGNPSHLSNCIPLRRIVKTLGAQIFGFLDVGFKVCEMATVCADTGRSGGRLGMSGENGYP